MNRQRHIDACRTQAIEMMNSPRGRESAEGGYYLAMFEWLYRELERGQTPTGIPAKLLEGWKASGEWLRASGRLK